MATSAVVVRPQVWTRAPEAGLALTGSAVVREPLGGRTWRGMATHRGDRPYAEVAVEVRFVDRAGRVVGGVAARADRLAPGGRLHLQSRLPAAATGVRVEALRWTVDGVRVERAGGPVPGLER